MIKIKRSTVIDAPIETVWETLRDFNSHSSWHPAIAASRIEERRASDEIGCVRDFRLKDGGALREQLLALSDKDKTLTYCILDAPVPLEGYVATLRLKPITDGNATFWEWESRFTAPPGQEAALSRLVAEDIYQAGFAAIRRLVVRAPERPPTTHLRPTDWSAPALSSSAGTTIAGAIVVAAYGGPEVLTWQTVEVPPPGLGQVRLRHTAIGINFIDVYCRTGAFDLLTPPGIPGMEAAGVVTDIGEGVRDLVPGDRVAYACAPVGAYCEARTMAADLLVRLPDDIDDRTAAAVLLKGLTAEFLLHRVHPVQEGDVVLVHAAAGGVGQLLTQWARALGAIAIGTAGSAEKVRVARTAGCAHTIDYSREDFAARIQEITNGRGVDVAYDAVGRDTIARSFDALAQHGHLVSYGQASGELPPLDIAAYAAKSARISRPNYGHYTDTPEKMRRGSDRLFAALRNGTLRIEPPRVFPLAEAAAAHRALETRQTTGALVLLPSSST
ncbi:MAG: zinc-binding dehydrogenase [Hyphomicrobiaceae bacterium]